VKYIVEIAGRRVTVDVSGEDVTVDGAALRAHLVEVPGTPVRLVTIGSETHRVLARREEGRGRYTLGVDGRRYEVEALDERTRAIRDLTAAAAGASGPAPLNAPMPGLIVRINVAAGDVVQVGQGLVVMEAMKMENELRSTSAGTVRSVAVQVGAAVEKGALLVELE
jgi:biotin carboxyl carrier protein